MLCGGTQLRHAAVEREGEGGVRAGVAGWLCGGQILDAHSLASIATTNSRIQQANTCMTTGLVTLQEGRPIILSSLYPVWQAKPSTTVLFFVVHSIRVISIRTAHGLA